MNTLAHNNSTPQYSTSQWEGSKPQRFKGGRKHDNHPPDELDHLLLGSAETQIKYLGPTKRRIEQKMAMGTKQQYKSDLRLFPQANSSNIVFSQQHIPRLIKIPPADNYKDSNSIIFRNVQLGNSKLKNLQTGNLKTGIYRNFYKSQFKQANKKFE